MYMLTLGCRYFHCPRGCCYNCASCEADDDNDGGSRKRSKDTAVEGKGTAAIKRKYLRKIS